MTQSDPQTPAPSASAAPVAQGWWARLRETWTPSAKQADILAQIKFPCC